MFLQGGHATDGPCGGMRYNNQDRLPTNSEAGGKSGASVTMKDHQ